MLGEIDRRIDTEAIPLRMRDKRFAPDDGYPDYLTIAEATVRAPFVRAAMDARGSVQSMIDAIREQDDD